MSPQSAGATEGWILNHLAIGNPLHHTRLLDKLLITRAGNTATVNLSDVEEKKEKEEGERQEGLSILAGPLAPQAAA